jgi:Cu/Ag efflux pump CusA
MCSPPVSTQADDDCRVILSLDPILWENGIGSDMMKLIAAPIVGGMITSMIHVLILVRCSSRS